MGKSGYLKKLKIVWGAILVGLIFYIVMAIILQNNDVIMSVDKTLEYYLQLIAVILVLSGVLLGRFISRRAITALKGDSVERAMSYQRIYIVTLAILEGSGFLSVTFYLLVSSGNLLLIALICVLLLLMQYPSATRISKESGIPEDELMNLEI